MKKIVIFILCLAFTLFCGCSSTNTNVDNNGNNTDFIAPILPDLEDTEDKDLSMLGLAEMLILLLKLISLSLFPIKHLGDLHTREILGEEGVDIGSCVLNAAVCAA